MQFLKVVVHTYVVAYIAPPEESGALLTQVRGMATGCLIGFSNNMYTRRRFVSNHPISKYLQQQFPHSVVSNLQLFMNPEKLGMFT